MGFVEGLGSLVKTISNNEIDNRVNEFAMNSIADGKVTFISPKPYLIGTLIASVLITIIMLYATWGDVSVVQLALTAAISFAVFGICAYMIHRQVFCWQSVENKAFCAAEDMRIRR